MIKRKRETPRRGPMRDPGYLDYLRNECACVVALSFSRRSRAIIGDCDPAHGPVNGRGSKGPDSGAVPLCPQHHREQHAIGWPAFESKYKISRAYEAEGLYKRYEQWKRETGVITE